MEPKNFKAFKTDSGRILIAGDNVKLSEVFEYANQAKQFIVFARNEFSVDIDGWNAQILVFAPEWKIEVDSAADSSSESNSVKSHSESPPKLKDGRCSNFLKDFVKSIKSALPKGVNNEIQQSMDNFINDKLSPKTKVAILFHTTFGDDVRSIYITQLLEEQSPHSKFGHIKSQDFVQVSSDLNGYTDAIIKKTSTEFDEIISEIKEFYFKKDFEKFNFKDSFRYDIFKLKESYLNLNVILMKLAQYAYVHSFVKAIKLECPFLLESKWTNEHIEHLLILNQHYDFLQNLQHKNGKIDISKDLKTNLEYSNDAIKFYNFVDEFHERLSDINKQKLHLHDAFLQAKNVSGYDSFEKSIESAFKTSADLNQFNEHLRDIHDLDFTSRFAAIVHPTLILLCDYYIHGPEIEHEPKSNTLTISGYFVKTSDVAEILRSKKYSLHRMQINIFALNEIWFNEDLDLRGNEMQINLIALKWTWDSSDRFIDLSGVDGKTHFPQRAENGKHGLPGSPGGNGGHFFGIGNVFEKNLKLHVYINGGSGGAGQNGGNGKFLFCATTSIVVQKYNRYALTE